MTTRTLTFAAAACLLIGSSGLGFAQNAAAAETSTSKAQELGSNRTSDVPGRLLEEKSDRAGTNFAAPQGTTGMGNNEPTVRPSEGSDK